MGGFDHTPGREIVFKRRLQRFQYRDSGYGEIWANFFPDIVFHEDLIGGIDP